MQKWLWLLIIGLLALAGVIFWWVRQANAPSSEAYRANVLEVLQGHGGLDPGLAFMLRGLRVDLDCRDEELCTRTENFSYVYDITEQYENLLGDYYGRICRSKHIKPSANDTADHQTLCAQLDALFKEVRGIKTKAAQAIALLQRNAPQEIRSPLVGILRRILAHRDRVLQITAELQKISWLAPALASP